MSDRANSQPFGRGETWYGGGVIDANDLGGAQHLGQEYEFEDIGFDSQGVKTARSGRKVKVRCVRNLSGVTLYGKRCVKLSTDGKTILGYTSTGGERGCPLDEFIGPNGVPTNDLCYVVIDGPAIVTTALSSLSSIVAGDPLQAVTTAAASTVAATTSEAGRVALASVGAPTNSTSVDLFLRSLGFQMFAMSAATTNNTGADLLVDVKVF